VRTSFDPATSQATSLEVHSKQLAPKEMPAQPKNP
jgi:hypothetical protein